MVKMGIWLEITTLLIPGLNDSDAELEKIAEFIFSQSPDIPWHISRFHPTYRLKNIMPTPPEKIKRAREIGYSAGLKYVYPGNLPGDEGEGTCCHNCGDLLIDRVGFTVNSTWIKKNSGCPSCRAFIPGVWKITA